MSDFWTNVLVLIVGGVLTAALLGCLGLTVRWALARLDKAGTSPRIRQWIAENAAYVRDGFRFKAILNYHYSTRKLRCTPMSRQLDGLDILGGWRTLIAYKVSGSGAMSARCQACAHARP